MVQLAIMGCRHAANGDIEPADTRALMVAFMDARRKARGEAKLVTPIASQQVSKLRQVLRLGAELGMGGVEMIEAVGSLRRAKLLRGASPRQFGEYNAVLAAAREALRKGRTLRGGELTKLLVKP